MKVINVNTRNYKEVVANTEARLALYKVTKESMSHAIRISNKALRLIFGKGGAA